MMYMDKSLQNSVKNKKKTKKKTTIIDFDIMVPLNQTIPPNLSLTLTLPVSTSIA